MITADKGAAAGQTPVRLLKGIEDSGAVGDFSKCCVRKVLNNAGMVIFIVFLQCDEVICVLFTTLATSDF